MPSRRASVVLTGSFVASKRYAPVTEGEWIAPISHRGYMLACCDCGLVHRMNFRIIKGRVQFQAFRSGRSTGQVRRRMKRTGAGILGER